MKLSCSSSTLALVAALLTLAVDVQAAGAATRTLPRTVSTWADLADEDIRGFWKSIIVLEDGGVAVAKTLTEVTNSYPWAVSSDYDKLARTDASGDGKWVRQWDGPVHVVWTGGAVDGVTDDAAALTKALTVADVVGCGVYIQSGTCLIGGATGITNSFSRIHLVGDPDGGSILQRTVYGSSSAYYFLLWGTNLTNVRIEHLTISKGYSLFRTDDTDGWGVDVDQVWLEDVHFKDSRYGLISSATPSTFTTDLKSLYAKGITASADTNAYTGAGLGALYFSSLPVRRAHINDFAFTNITQALVFNKESETTGNSRVLIENGEIADIGTDATRGDVKALSLTKAGGVVQNVLFRNGMNYGGSGTFEAIYANSGPLTVRACRFVDWAPHNTSHTLSIKERGPVLVENCEFTDTNGRSTGSAYVQFANIRFRHCLWNGFTKSGDFLLTVGVLGGLVSGIDVSDCVFTNINVGTGYLFKNSYKTEDAVLRFSDNVFDGITANRVIYNPETTVNAALIISGNYATNLSVSIFASPEGSHQVSITDNNVFGAGEFVYTSTANSMPSSLYLDGNYVDSSTADLFIANTSPAVVMLGENTFAGTKIATGPLTFGSGESVTNWVAALGQGNTVRYHGSLTTSTNRLPPGSFYWDTTQKALAFQALGTNRFMQPLSDVGTMTLSADTWLTAGTDEATQVITSADSTKALGLSATNAVGGLTWHLVNQDGSNTVTVNNTDGSTLIKTIGTSSWAEFRWTGSTYVLVGYGGL